MSATFTRQVFAWLHQINRGGYLAIDVRVALELSDYFTESDQGGRAFPGYKTLAEAIGISERTVMRSIDRMRAKGDLYVIPGKPGRGHPNQYWMVLADSERPKTCTQAQVSEAAKPAPATARKPANRPPKTCTQAQENHKNQIPSWGCQEATPKREGERVAPIGADSSPRGAGASMAPPAQDSSKQESKWTRNGSKEERITATDSANGTALAENSAEDSAADLLKNEEPPAREGSGQCPDPRAFAELRAIWARGWASDATPKALAIGRQAFERACREGADPGAILDAARAWVAAADAPRFLPPLPTWLASRSWERPPPKRPKRAAAQPRQQYSRHGKPDMLAVGLKLSAMYEQREREAAAERGVVS